MRSAGSIWICGIRTGQASGLFYIDQEWPACPEAIRDLLQTNPGIETEPIYEWLIVRDIQMAADQLFPIYEQSNGLDGYVSLEVSPHLANDTESTLSAARWLWERVKRPNLMIKVPGTLEGGAAHGATYFRGNLSARGIRNPII